MCSTELCIGGTGSEKIVVAVCKSQSEFGIMEMVMCYFRLNGCNDDCRD